MAEEPKRMSLEDWEYEYCQANMYFIEKWAEEENIEIDKNNYWSIVQGMDGNFYVYTGYVGVNNVAITCTLYKWKEINEVVVGPFSKDEMMRL